MMQEAWKRRCNKIKFISLSFVSKLFSQKILIKNVCEVGKSRVNVKERWESTHWPPVECGFLALGARVPIAGTCTFV